MERMVNWRGGRRKRYGSPCYSYRFFAPAGFTVWLLLRFTGFFANLDFAYIDGSAIVPGGTSLSGRIVISDYGSLCGVGPDLRRATGERAIRAIVCE